MNILRRFLLFIVGLLCIPATLNAQFTPTYVFTPGTPILAAQVNANFALLADALNRKGGTITGNIAVNSGITIDGADISAFLISTGQVRAQTAGTVGAPSFAPTGDTATGVYFPAAGQIGLVLSGAERMRLDGSGLWVYGNNVINASGKIPAITSSYFTSLDGSAITNIQEANIIDGTILARVAANETITGAWTFNPGTITTAVVPVTIDPTWNSGTTVFTGLDINVTNTASATGSLLANFRVGGTSVASVDATGKLAVSTLQMSTGAVNGDVLTSDASGNATWQTLPAGVTGVPSGMVAMFEAACPSGWTSRSAAGQPYQNKFVRGGAVYDGVGGGSDTHTHTIDPPSTATSTDGAHTHTVDPAVASTSTDGAHTHAPSSRTTSTSTDGAHSHTTNFGTITTDGPNNTVPTDNGTGASAATAGHTHNVTIGTLTSSTDGAHSHTVTWPDTDSAGAHSHTVDIPATTSSSAGAHSHTVDIAPFTSASASNVPAYVQVVFCKKN